MKVAVTENEYKKAKSVFCSANGMKFFAVPSEEHSLAKKIISIKAKYVIVGTEKYVGPLYDALPKKGVIARFGVAHDGIDKEKVKKASLFCTNTPDVLTNSVAELTLAHVMIASRQMVDIIGFMKQGHWQPQMGTELMGKTIAVIGCGAIGKRVAQIASFGFQMNVIGYDTQKMDPGEMKQIYGFSTIANDFHAAVKEADFVTIHMPLLESTKHFINLKRLHMMHPKAWLINTARGAIIEETDLFFALNSGVISGAALDVFVNEPYHPVKREYDLRLLNNVLFTPHIGSTTNEASIRIAKRCLSNIKFAEKGEYEKMDLIG